MEKTQRALIISAHADDETFGMGGTLARLRAAGVPMSWVVMSRVWEPRWSAEAVAAREADIDRVATFWGFDHVDRWDFPDNRMDTFAVDDFQQALIPIVNRDKPDTIFCPSPWDWNWEHRLACDVVEASTKPGYSPFVRRILAYEVPSSTDWAFKGVRKFAPNYYVDIEGHLDAKVAGCELFSTEIYDFPHSRSAEGVRHLAAVRGMEVGRRAAEAFAVLRWVE